MAPNTKYEQVSKERMQIISAKYGLWVNSLTDMNKEPVTVFEPLSQKIVEELELIREVSRELQNKKDEDIRKAAQAAEIQETETAEGENETEDGEKTEEQEGETTEKTEQTV